MLQRRSQFSLLALAPILIAAGQPAVHAQKAETAKLRGYGAVSAQFTANRALFRCQDARHADMLQGKLLADLFWDAGKDASVQHLPLKSGTAVIHVWPGYGAMLAARAGAQVLVLGADSVDTLRTAAAKEALLSRPGVSYAADKPYPNYLDFYDLKGFKAYAYASTSTHGFGLESHWPFVQKFGLGGIAFQSPTFNISNPAPGVIEYGGADYEVHQAEQAGGMAVLGFSAGGEAPFWTYNDSPDTRMQPSPTALLGAWNKLGPAGAMFESWFTPLEQRKRAGLDFGRRVMERYVNSPALGGWHVYGGAPGLEAGSHERTDEFWDYSPAGQAGFRAWLRDNRHYSLADLGRRWQGNATAYKSWSQVQLPDVNGFFGDLNAQAFPLAEGWRWMPAAGKADDPLPTTDAPGWVPVALPPSQQQDTLPWGDAYYRTSFDASLWLKQDAGKSVYLICDLHIRTTEPASVWINGEYIGKFKTKQTDYGPFGLDLTELIHPGQNEIALRIPGEGKIMGPVFLTHTEPHYFPHLGKERNAQWADVREWQSWARVEYHRPIFDMARQIDPNRPMILSTGDIGGIGAEAAELARNYGLGIQFTGREAFYFPWWSGLGYVDGFYSTSEPSATTRGSNLDRMLSWTLFDGDSHHSLFLDIEDYQQYEKETGWFTKNRRLIQLFGKALREKPSIAILRSTKTSILGDGTPFGWDIGRGELQAAHYDNVYATEKEVIKGLVQDYPVLFDSGTVVMDDDMVAALRKYVEAGGTFVALHNTGRHTTEMPDSFPVSALTGFQVLASNQGGKIRFGKGLPIFKKWEGREIEGEGSSVDWRNNQTAKGIGLVLKAAAPGAVPLAAWEDGSIAVGYRHLGKGRVITLGSSFWRSGKDTAGIWQSQSELERGFFQELFSDLGVARNASSDNTDVWTRKYVTKNGLQDWLIAYNDSDTPTTTGLSLHVGRRPAQVINMVSEQPVDFTYTDDGWAHFKATLPVQSTLIFGVRRANLVGGLPVWWGEKTKYWRAVSVPAPAASAPPPTSTATIPLYTWKFLPDRDGSVSRSGAWQTSAFDDSSWRAMPTGSWTMLDKSLANYHGTGLYRAHFRAPKAWGDRKVVLGLYSFDGALANDHADFAVNGKAVTSYQAQRGSQTLTYVISDKLQPGDNVVTVQVTGGKDFAGFMGSAWIGTERTLSPSMDLSGPWQAVAGDFVTQKQVTMPGSAQVRCLRRDVSVPAEWKGRSVFLHVETPDQWIGCFMINGHPITYNTFMHHFGIRTEVNLTPYLKPGQSNRIELWPLATLPQYNGQASNDKEQIVTVQAITIGCERGNQ